MTVKTKLIVLIVFGTLLRCITAMTVELGNDEVYYLTYAQHLQWNYFDHPPMVAVLIRITTFDLFFKDEFFIRLGPILLAAINTLLIFNLTRKIKDERAGFIAALLFSASPYCSIIAGIFILPDAPQLFFWILSISLLIDIVSGKPDTRHHNYKMMLFGLASGLCIMGKVHGIFLWVGFGFYILFYQRKLLTNGYLYMAILITAVIISPILIWNIQNDFITYTYHSNRVSINNGVQIDSFLREFAGGIFYNNPITYGLIILALPGIFKNSEINSGAVKKLLFLLSLPLILMLFFISFFRDTLPHWSGPAYIPLIILTSCYIAYKIQHMDGAYKRLSRLVFASGIFLTVIMVTAIVLINYLPGTIGKKNNEALGDGDFTLDMYGWNEVKTAFKKVYDGNISSGVSSTTFVINNKWFPGAHIDHYIAQPLNLDFIGMGDLNDIHTYAWLNRYRKRIKPGDDAYFITVSNNFCDPSEKYKDAFETINKPVIIQQRRGGAPVRNISIYLLKKYKGNQLY